MAEEDFENENLSPEQIAKMQKENCIFCKLISGDIPSKKVYEDPDFVGILDINPASEGHVLLLPRLHFQILPQMPPELVGNLGIACSNVSSKVIKAFKCEGTSIFMANGAVAGQRAPHFMVHIMPRKEGDSIELNPKLKDINDKIFDEVKEKLFSSMKRHPQSQPKQKENTEERETEEQEEQQDKENKVYVEPEDETITDNDLDKNDSNESNEPENEEQEETIAKEKTKKKKSAPKKKKTENAEQKQDSKSEPQRNKIDYDKLSRMFG